MRRKPKPPFNRAAALAFARDALLVRPKKGAAWSRRREPPGPLVLECVLPLDLCPTVNKLADMPSWKRKKTKDAALGLMAAQAGFRRFVEFDRQATVHVVRFSCREIDTDASGSKIPVDRLTTKNGGLGLFRDDAPEHMDLWTWWEYASPGKGFVLVRVFEQIAKSPGEPGRDGGS